jgi:hypothetical protein
MPYAPAGNRAQQSQAFDPGAVVQCSLRAAKTIYASSDISATLGGVLRIIEVRLLVTHFDHLPHRSGPGNSSRQSLRFPHVTFISKIVHRYGRRRSTTATAHIPGTSMKAPVIRMSAQRQTSTLIDTRHNRHVSTGRVICLASIIGASQVCSSLKARDADARRHK